MTLLQALFGFEGRINRTVFWLAWLAVVLLDLAVMALMSDWIHARYMLTNAPAQPGAALVWAGIGFVAATAGSAWIGLALQVKRAHDLGRSGWWLTTGLIPVYGPVRLMVDLGFRAGSKRRNRYGAPLGHIGGLDETGPNSNGSAGGPAGSEPDLAPPGEPSPGVQGAAVKPGLVTAPAEGYWAPASSAATATKLAPLHEPANDQFGR
jgi:uncharacterized membrane protein YhaH (DUF805 family)